MINIFRYSYVNKYKNIIKKINLTRKNLQYYDDQMLKDQTRKLRNKLSKKLDKNNECLIEAFATIKEATFRGTKMELFDVQLMGGIVLNEGNISEMKTGEGKTLVALLSAYLNCLIRKGVHIVTVNDYLAERDSNLAKEIFAYLDIKIGLVTQQTQSDKRKLEYDKDIIYITNSELGFDYLKDNMAIHKNEILQKRFSYAIIDEVDSILIDEARTPLIISGTASLQENFYKDAKGISEILSNETDYTVDEKSKSIILTKNGITKCEQILKIENIYSINSPWIKYILNALKAKELFIKNKEYIVKNNQITIVDEFTGRVMTGRRWSDGLHQAIEAKENIKIEAENKTLASITYQNLFLLYDKISGMTGTAKTEEEEFISIYKMNVIEIPTNKKCIRKDLADLVYKDQYNKWKAIANECLDMYKIGRPTLIGTTSIENSELLSKMLHQLKVPHNLLNAKPENIAQESDIILQAGKKNTITIATNMAGRGTDIILGGSKKKITEDTVREYLIKDEKSNYQKNLSNIQTIRSNNDNQLNEKIEVLDLGGLYVIGTERHESRRIDNQLRGRSGRQGDKGTSRFFLSLQDNLFRIFGGSTIENIVSKLNIDNDVPIESLMLTKSLDSAQKKVEAYFYDIRKQLFEYDDVINNQRKAIYKERKRILDNSFTRDCIIEYGEQTIQEMLNFYIRNDNKKTTLEKVLKLLNVKSNTELLMKMEINEIKDYLGEQFRVSYDLKEIYLEQLRPGLIRQLEKYYLLQQIDRGWQEHLNKMSLLKEYISWRSYGQQDPLIEYKNEAFNLFINMITYIRQTVIYLIMRSRLVINL